MTSSQPDVASLNKIARLFLEQDRPDEAIVCYRRVLSLERGNIEASCNLVSALRSLGRVDDAIDYCRAAITANPDALLLYDNLLFTLQFSSAYGPAEIHIEHEHWRQRFAAALEASIQPHQNDRSSSRRLRVGYVSSHFGSHVQTAFVLPPLPRA